MKKIIIFIFVIFLGGLFLMKSFCFGIYEKFNGMIQNTKGVIYHGVKCILKSELNYRNWF